MPGGQPTTVKVADTVRRSFIVTVQEVAVPAEAHAPPQPEKAYPLAGRASRTTIVPYP